MILPFLSLFMATILNCIHVEASCRLKSFIFTLVLRLFISWRQSPFRCGLITDSSLPLLIVPVTRSTGSPFLNMIKVGKPIIP